MGVARPQQVLRLERGNRVHAVGPADRGGGGLGQTEEADLPLAHQISHLAHGVFDGNHGVHAVLVVESDA